MLPEIAPRRIPTTFRTAPTIIWAGSNNKNDPTTVESDIAAMVAILAPGTPYLILAVMNNSAETIGTTPYNNTITINNYLATTYGSHYIDIRSYLVSLYDPNNSQDVIDHANDITPSSLRYDTIHLTATGYRDVATKIYQNLALLQYNSQTVLTPLNLPFAFGNPPPIGAVAPNFGSFTSLAVGTTTPIFSTLTLGGNASIGADYAVAAPANGLLVEGNVGIGTTSPLSKLTVEGVSSSAGAGGITLTSTTGSSQRAVFYPNGTGSSAIAILQSSGVFSIQNSSFTDLLRIQGSNGSLAVGTSSSALSKFVLAGNASIGADYGVAAPTNGLIVEESTGIGTTTPVSKLTVEGGSNTAGGIVLTSTSNSSQRAAFYPNGGTSAAIAILQSSGVFSIQNSSLSDLLRIQGSNGNTAVGTTSIANSKLVVGSNVSILRFIDSPKNRLPWDDFWIRDGA